MRQRPETGPHWSCYICNADNKNKQEKSEHKIVGEISNIEVLFIGARVIRKQTGTILAMTTLTLDFKNTLLGSVTYMAHAIKKIEKSEHRINVQLPIFSLQREWTAECNNFPFGALQTPRCSFCIVLRRKKMESTFEECLITYFIKKVYKVLGY